MIDHLSNSGLKIPVSAVQSTQVSVIIAARRNGQHQTSDTRPQTDLTGLLSGELLLF